MTKSAVAETLDEYAKEKGYKDLKDVMLQSFNERQIAEYNAELIEFVKRKHKEMLVKYNYKKE